MTKEDLRIKAKLTTNAIANMGKDRNVSMQTLLKICETLHCDLGKVVEISAFDNENTDDQQPVQQSSADEQDNPLGYNESTVEESGKKNAPRLVSLFSGCGGMDVGFDQAGFHRVWANDFDSDAQAVFRLNLGEIDGRDITTVPEDDIPDCDIITAGFPCQPFSNAGNRKGVYDERGELYLECLRIIDNVVGIRNLSIRIICYNQP